jgi:hypothetical protein
MKFFEKNVGQVDRIVRIVLGVALLATAYLWQAGIIVQGIVGLVGLVALFTGIIGTCALYSLVGINTNKK